ncbi:uncharacterized protein LOC117113899 [Anneissia japonica]|uniref:uncharacterized protein LOC117113899 n=1 Tax=Anneissia japonica TaxID=1529436 RepID=UPI0014256AF1|nr:uncharacterized protein LOC117113899 [Anneissia japonica]
MFYKRILLLLLITVCIAYVVGRCRDDGKVPVSGSDEWTGGECDESGGGSSSASGGGLSGKSGEGSGSALVKVSGKLGRVSRSASGEGSSSESGGGSSSESGEGSRDASGSGSRSESGGGSISASGRGSSGASGSGSRSESGEGSRDASGSGSRSESGGGSISASGGGSSGASGSGSRSESGEGSRDASGEVSRSESGEGSRDASGSGSRSESGGGSISASGGGSSGASGSGSRSESGEGSRDASGEGSRSESGEGSRDASGSGSRGASGGVLRSESGGGPRNATGSGSSGASGGGSRNASGSGSRNESGEGSRGASGSGSRDASGGVSRSESGGGPRNVTGSGSSGASGGGSRNASGSGSRSESGEGSRGASGSGSRGASGGVLRSESGGGPRNATGSGSSGASGGGSRNASGSGSSGASGGGSRNASGSGSRSESGEGSRSESGEGSRGASGSGSGGASGGGSRDASGSGSSSESGEGSGSESGEGSRGASGSGSSGASGGGSRNASGSGSRSESDEGSSSASDEGSSGYFMNRYEYIGLEYEGKIHNNAFEASSDDGEYTPERARLNGETSWHNDPDDSNPWISVDLGQRENVYGIITQGDGTKNVVRDGWVTAFRLRLSNDSGFSEFVFAVDATGNETFRSDVTTRYDRKINMFQNGITAQYVKLHVSQCSDGGCFLRMELLKRRSYDCSETCRNVGLSDKHKIRNGAFDGSSHNGGQTEPKRARLGGGKSWHNDPDDTNPWISVAFGRTVNIFGIITQGDGSLDSDRDGWVTEFALEFSDHADFSEPTFAVSTNGSQTFFANPSSRNDQVENMFQNNVTARHVKLHVRACSEVGCYLRMDFIECGSFLAECLTAKKCEYVGISNDDVIKNIAFRASSNDGEQTQPSRARLDGIKSWHSRPDDPSPWIIVDLARTETVFGIITQGEETQQANQDGWVTEFELEFSQYYYFNESVYAFNEFGSQIFYANHSRYKSVLNMFQHNVTADYVKLHIKACSNVGCFLRMELIKCTGTEAATRYGQTFRSVSKVVTGSRNATNVQQTEELVTNKTAESQNTTDRRRPRPRPTPRGGNFVNSTRNQHENTETKTSMSTTVLMTTTEPQTTTLSNVFADVENLLDDASAGEVLNAATSTMNRGPEKTYNRKEIKVLNSILRRVSLKNSSNVEEYRNNTRAVLKITKVLFQPKQKLFVAEKLSVASMAEDILSSSAETIPTGESVVVNEDNMVAAMYHVKSINQIADMVFDIVIPEENNGTSYSSTYYLRAVIPDGVEFEEGSFGMTIIYMGNEQSATELSHSEEEDVDAIPASGIMSCTLTSGSKKVQIGVNFTLPVNTSGINDGKDHVVIPKKIKFRKATERITVKECVFWNNDLGLWSEYGCQNVATGEGTVSCECNHTTSFAVLVQVNEREISTIHDTILTIISYAGGAVSVASLVLVIGLTFYLKELEKSDHVLIMKNLMITLALGQTIFLVGVDRTESMIVCKGVALILHYLFLAMFMWMFNEGLYLYRRLWLVFGINSTSSREYKYTGWAIPGVYVAICFIMRFSEYGTEESCWLSQENGLVWTFVGPVLVIIVMNVILLLLVARIIIKASKEVGSTYDRVKKNTRKSILVLPVLGLTWIFGVLIMEPVIIAFTYLFVIFVSFQGLLVAVYCFTSTEVQTAWINKRAENSPIKQATWATKRTNSVSSLHGMPSYQGDTFYEDFGKIVPYRIQFGYRPNIADSMSKKRAPKCIDRELCQNNEMRSPPPSYEDTVKTMVREETK